jgi:hypothetical protein
MGRAPAPPPSVAWRTDKQWQQDGDYLEAVANEHQMDSENRLLRKVEFNSTVRFLNFTKQAREDDGGEFEDWAHLERSCKPGQNAPYSGSFRRSQVKVSTLCEWLEDEEDPVDRAHFIKLLKAYVAKYSTRRYFPPRLASVIGKGRSTEMLQRNLTSMGGKAADDDDCPSEAEQAAADAAEWYAEIMAEVREKSGEDPKPNSEDEESDDGCDDDSDDD